MKQDALLDPVYIKQFMDSQVIPRFKVKYNIIRSLSTNSTYLRLTYRKGITINIRISDHYSQKKNMKQFLISPNKKLTIYKRKLFYRTIINSIEFAKTISMYKYMKVEEDARASRKNDKDNK